MARHSNTLAWKIPWAEEPSKLQSMGPHRVGHDWAHNGIKVLHYKVSHIKKKKNTQQRNQKAQDKQKTKGKVADVILIISKIIPLNVNGLNNLSKRQRLSYWIKKKQKTNIYCCLLEIHSSFKTTIKLNVKWLEKIYHVSNNNKKPEIAILMSDNTDFKQKLCYW